MLTLDEKKNVIKDGGSIRMAGGDIVTDPDRLEDALAEAAAMPAPKKAIYPSLDELVDAKTEAETLKGQLVSAKVALAEDDALITTLTGDKAVLVETNQKLTGDNAALITQMGELEADKTALTADKVALEADKTALQAQITDLQKQLTAATKKAAAATPDGPPAAS